MDNKSTFTLDISLHTVEHLGINLYSSLPATLAEIVANAYDADATCVDISKDNQKIIVSDDGIGMDINDANSKYLTVGYKRRSEGAENSPNGRIVMGRKGVGKLSLFAIAKSVEIITKKENGTMIGFKLLLDKIIECAKAKAPYHPRALENDAVEYYSDNIKNHGTVIVLDNLQKKRLAWESLKEKIARRFACFEDDFSVRLDGNNITYADRNYFKDIEYCWLINKESIPQEIVSLLPQHNKDEEYVTDMERDDIQSKYDIYGWVGSSEKHTRYNNAITLIVRKKVAVENILNYLTINQVGADYLVGEIYVDYLDIDEKDDITTTGRQGFLEDDERFKETREYLKRTITTIASQWSNKRQKKGASKIFERFEPVKQWYEGLDKNSQKKARIVLGKIHTLKASDTDIPELVKAGVLAVEKSKFYSIFEHIDTITKESLEVVKEMFNNLQAWESTYFYEITRLRLKVIGELQEKVQGNALEKVVKEYIYEHLWLLDPAWEHPTEDATMEYRLETSKCLALSKEEERLRIDIKYRKAGSEHVIVELKRESAPYNHFDLLKQIAKYGEGMQKILDELNDKQPIKTIILIGSKAYSTYSTGSESEHQKKEIEGRNAIVQSYEFVIDNAKKRYKGYLEKSKDAEGLIQLIDKIQNLKLQDCKIPK